MEASNPSLNGSVSLTDVSRVLDTPYSIVQKILYFTFLSLQNQAYAFVAE